MKCPFSENSDTVNENFSEFDSGCKRCFHYEECCKKAEDSCRCVGDNHPAFSASTRNKLQNKYPEFYDKKRFEKGKILQEDIINFSFDLLANDPKEIWYELSHLRGVK